jgi:transcriptional regulator with XRE-family HTH domain
MRIKTATDLGALVRDRRKAFGWTLDDLAERTPMSRRWIVDVEAGNSGAAIGSVLDLLAILGLELNTSPRETSADVALDAHLENLDREER